MRFRSRHAQQTIADHVQAHLTALGWAGPAVPFGATPVTFREVEPDTTGGVPYNTVSTTLGDEPDFEPQEVGHGLLSWGLPVYIDVYGEKTSITLSIASDIRDALFETVIPLVDYTASTPVQTADTIEFEGIVVNRPQQVNTAIDFKRYWRTVSALAVVYFVEL